MHRHGLARADSDSDSDAARARLALSSQVRTFPRFPWRTGRSRSLALWRLLQECPVPIGRMRAIVDACVPTASLAGYTDDADHAAGTRRIVGSKEEMRSEFALRFARAAHSISPAGRWVFSFSEDVLASSET